MIPSPHGPLHAGGAQRIGTALVRPRWQPGEQVDGWVTAEITPFPRPLASLDAPFEAQFVLAVVEYPSGPISKWGCLRWRSVEIVLRSAHCWPVAVDRHEPLPKTAELARCVEQLGQQALALGWEPAGRGQTWCSLRFRRRCEELRGQLQWR